MERSSHMAIEDTFSGAKNAFVLHQAFVNTVAQEIGRERASALETKMCETMGALQGKMAKEQAGVEEFDAKAAHLVCDQVVGGLGLTAEVIEESPREVVVKAGRCPIFEAAQMVGQDVQTSEAACRAGAVRFMDTLVKQLNPNLRYELRKYRSAPEEACVEAIVLA
jgi:hypothetical protein